MVDIQIQPGLPLAAQVFDFPALQDKFVGGHLAEPPVGGMDDLLEIFSLHIGFKIQLNTAVQGSIGRTAQVVDHLVLHCQTCFCFKILFQLCPGLFVFLVLAVQLKPPVFLRFL